MVINYTFRVNDYTSFLSDFLQFLKGGNQLHPSVIDYIVWISLFL